MQKISPKHSAIVTATRGIDTLKFLRTSKHRESNKNGCGKEDEGREAVVAALQTGIQVARSAE